jgi:hypothetical protein
VLQDFDPMAELAEYLEADKEQAEPYQFDMDAFLAALLRKGLLLEVEYGTFYLGGYSSASSIFFAPAKS